MKFELYPIGEKFRLLITGRKCGTVNLVLSLEELDRLRLVLDLVDVMIIESWEMGEDYD